MEGHQFQLWTDHKPLLVALHRLSEPWTPKQQRQLAFIDEFVPSVSNIVADTLSQPLDALVCNVAADVPGLPLLGR